MAPHRFEIKPETISIDFKEEREEQIVEYNGKTYFVASVLRIVVFD